MLLEMVENLSHQQSQPELCLNHSVMLYKNDFNVTGFNCPGVLKIIHTVKTVFRPMQGVLASPVMRKTTCRKL